MTEERLYESPTYSTELVYSPLMNTNERLNEAFSRISQLEGNRGIPRPHEAPMLSSAPNWWGRNHSWASLAISTIVSTVIAVLIAIYTVRAPIAAQNETESFWLRMDQHIDARLSKPLETLSAVDKRIERLDGKLEGVLAVQRGLTRGISDVPRILPQKLDNAASGDKADLQLLPAYLVAAKDQNFRMSLPAIDSIGKRMLAKYGAQTASDSTSWQAILELLNYRSYLNLVNKSEISTLQLMLRPEKPETTVVYADLSGQKLDRVVFRDLRIYYDGVSPLSMQTVSFTNCVFYMPKTDKSLQLASMILSNRFISGSIR